MLHLNKINGTGIAYEIKDQFEDENPAGTKVIFILGPAEKVRKL